MKFSSLIAIVVFMTNSFCLADEIVPNLGFSINSIDTYDLSTGVLIAGNNHGAGICLTGNHFKAGLTIPLFLKTEGDISLSRILFFRPRYEYYFSEDNSLSLENINYSSIGIDIGAGVSGHSPLLNVFISYKYSLSDDDNIIGIGLAINL